MHSSRFLVKSFGDNPEGCLVGLKKLFDLAGTHRSCVIVVPNFNQLQHSLLTTVLGEQLTKTLIKNRKITLENQNTIELCSQATLKNFRYAEAYLALWGTKHTVDDIEALQQWTSFILVTWLPEDSTKWERDYNVQVIYDDGKHQ